MKNSLYTRFRRYIIRLGNVKTRRILLQLDDRILEDAGISRELLEQGVGAWPWRVAQTTCAPFELVEQDSVPQEILASAAGNIFKHAA